MILDTNAVSDFADANQGLLDRLQQSAEDIHLPVIVLGEYRYGVKSSRLRAARGSWLDELESTAVVLAVTSDDQMRRATSSVGMNLMEGAMRLGSKEYRQFVGIARGSAGEVCYQLLLAKDLQYITGETYGELLSGYERVIQMLSRLSQTLNR